MQQIKRFVVSAFLFLLFALPVLSEAAWEPYPGRANAIAAGGGAVWMLGVSSVGGGYPIMRLSGGGWRPIDGGAVAIAVSPDGRPWVVNMNGEIFRRSHRGWDRLPGSATDIAVGGDGSVWVVGTTPTDGGYEIYRWAEGNWVKVEGGARRIAVDNNGKPWVVNDRGEIFRMTYNGWQKLPGSAVAIAVGGDHAVWVVGTTPTDGGYQIYRWRGGNWQSVDGGAMKIAVDENGSPWVVNNRGEIFRRGHGFNPRPNYPDSGYPASRGYPAPRPGGNIHISF